MSTTPGGNPNTPDPLSGLGTLQTALEDAVRLVEEVAADPVMRRVLDSFMAMPAEDRDIIASVIEREVQGRLLNRATGEVTGQATRPNPHARLYVRSHGSSIPRSALEEEEMMLGTIRMMQVMRFLLVPDIYEAWRRATRAALDHVDDDQLGHVEKLLHDVLELIADRRWAGRD